MDSFKFITKIGSQINDIASDFAQLRITVFKEFPYLYNGSLEYEMEYIQVYSQSEKAMIFGIYDGDQLIGATTCTPLSFETNAVQLPFKKQQLDIDSIFYFGESILLPEYRGKGFGHLFFDERERHVQSFGTYKTTCFCAVNRPDDHPLRPENYHPNDTFWLKRGYQKNPELACEMEWLDMNQTIPTNKTLIFWIKNI